MFCTGMETYDKQQGRDYPKMPLGVDKDPLHAKCAVCRQYIPFNSRYCWWCGHRIADCWDLPNGVK